MNGRRKAGKAFKSALAALAAALAACSCETAYETLRADPLPPTSFLPESALLVEQKASFPFRFMWRNPKADWFKYAKYKFEPVDATRLVEEGWWSKISEANVLNMKKDIPELAGHMRTAFSKELLAVSKRSLTPTDSVDGKTAVVRLAIVQLVPTKAFFNVVGTTVGFFLPGASLVNVANAGSVAMECKVYDGGSGELLMMLSDREKDESALIDIKGYTWYGHAKDIMDGWAKGFAELAVKKDPDRVKKDFPISIISI